ncbi:putative MFS general substrate transporter [Lyophyllum shimeji]|uniref:MFS general substrate transporter n=1 Tax=Lyophyllum shimeji TaxID=47721 RepID=A0A9P3PCG4_LYOSH|nr:putative MFS general substrate transporter [Lyophyllum shimeji]
MKDGAQQSDNSVPTPSSRNLEWSADNRPSSNHDGVELFVASMASKSAQYPGLISVPRFTTLIASLLVTLSSGTNYVYSAYAPQLGSRLGITHTQLNIVGLGGNIGVYSSGPIWGRIVDLRGPRILLASSFALLLAGYSGIRYIYDSGIPASSTTISTFTFCVLVVCSFMTGSGGNAGLTSAVNSTAKTFPDKARATTTGIVISGFGLSAFLFSTISRVEFAGNTSSFLLLLSLGTSIPMIIGYFFIRPIPLPPTDPVAGVEQGGSRSESDALNHEDSENHALLASEEDLPIAPVQLSRRAALSQGLLPNVYGRKLWTSKDFWLLFTILSLLSGTGLMFINNVGSMSQALYAKSTPIYDPVEAARWQADQVSMISLLNFLGRIFIGLVTDYGKNRYGLPRSYSLGLVSFFFFISQVMAANVDDIRNLWMASAMLGLAHGSVFSLFPNVCLEWFGMPHFSENWGYLSISPIFAGNLFSVAFGRNLDAHETTPTESLASSTSVAVGQCTLGRQCYVDAIYLTAASCFIAMLLSVLAGWRDRQKLEMGARIASRRSEVVWESNEDE